MRISKIFLAALLTFGSAAGWAQNKGGIDPKMLGELRDSYKNTAEDKALRNALAGTDIQKLASNADVSAEVDGYFSHRVPTKGITDQESSGRCWLFSGLNVLRAKMMAEHHLPECEFSQAYCFFYDQLEPSYRLAAAFQCECERRTGFMSVEVDDKIILCFVGLVIRVLGGNGYGSSF